MKWVGWIQWRLLQRRTSSYLKHHSRLLQQVSPHVGTYDVESLVEADLDVLPETTAVVITGGFGVSN